MKKRLQRHQRNKKFWIWNDRLANEEKSRAEQGADKQSKQTEKGNQ